MTRHTLTMLVLLGGASWAGAADGPAGEVRFGVVAAMFKNLPAGTAKVLGGPLRSLFAQRAGVTGGEIVLAPDSAALAKQVADGTCQLGVFQGFEFAWAKARHPELEPLVVTVYPAGRPRACVVVREDSPATTLSDLKGQAVTVPVFTRGHCLIYLEKQRAGLPATTAAPLPPKGTPEEALDAVVSAAAPAALMDASALAGYASLYPGAAKRLRVLCQSEAFPQNVIAYAKGRLPTGTADKLRAALVDAHRVPAGKPLMMLWNIARLDHAPADYADHLSESLKSYPFPAGQTSAADSD
ncbi:MAG: PhnD/SsuA/transferrin family substrate-binding protein [Gemmataceae bacterium]